MHCEVVLAALLVVSGGVIILALPSDQALNWTQSVPVNLADMYLENFSAAASETNKSSKLVKRSISMDQLGHAMPHLKPIAAQRRAGPEIANSVEIYRYSFPFIAAAQIGEYTFSCRQDNGLLEIYQRIAGSNNVRVRRINGEFSFHPQVGIWWFVKCVGFETGGSGLDIKGVQKPGQDSGIDPNALKSLIG